MEMPLLPDNEAAIALLRDAEKHEQEALDLLKESYERQQELTEKVRKALASPASTF